MIRFMIGAFYCLIFSYASIAQRLPPVTILDRNKWKTFNAWDGMRKVITPGDTITEDHEDWGQARCTAPFNQIHRDENVYLKDGYCHLSFKHEKSYWKCKSCHDTDAVTSNYTSGNLRTFFYKNGQRKSFNSGKFEARISMPIFNYAHSTFWTWHGSIVNEIDIAEAYGNPANPYWPIVGGNNLYCDYSTHSWPPDSAHNFYRLPHIEIMHRYPGQAWWDVVYNRYFDQKAFHTYSCIWDTTHVAFYLDNQWVNTIHKYYRDREITMRYGPFGLFTRRYWVRETSPCITSGTWEITPGFPWNNFSESNLNLTTGIDKDESDPNDNRVYELGEMVVDYVKVWQRHPEQDGNVDLCAAPSTPVITGPAVICDQATYTVAQAVPGAHWSVSPGLQIISSSASQITVRGIDGYKINAITYDYTPSACPQKLSVSKIVEVGKPVYNNIIAARTRTGNRVTYSMLLFRIPLAVQGHGSTVEWNLKYGPGNVFNTRLFGNVVSTQPVIYTPNSGVQWEVKVTNICGSYQTSGAMNWVQKGTGEGEQTSTIDYFSAIITDSIAYESAVEKRVRNLFVTEDEDTLSIQTKIEQIRLEELAPYLVTDEEFDMAEGKRIAAAVSDTRIFPNPASQTLSIAPGKAFAAGAPVEVKVFNVFGKLVKTSGLHYDGSVLTLDISALPNAVYTVMIEQNGVKELKKIVKHH